MEIHQSILELIGNTPMVELKAIEKEFNLNCKLIAKIEMFNPGGSIKSRTAQNMIFKALEDGQINKDTVIIESTSGNTGVGLAFICATLGMRFIATMPENMSQERQKLIKAYGGEIVLTPAGEGMKGAVDRAKSLAKELGNSFIASQFTNLNNPEIHFKTTGVEIFNQTDGLVDIVVAGIGTGGTISGISKYLKSKKDIKAIGVEPLSSPLITKGIAGPHKIQGIGANFIPDTLDLSYVDEVLPISNEDAYYCSQMLARKEGLFVGISSGAALAGALKEAKKEENKNKMIVVIFPDTGERYLSTEGFIK